jgi:MoaA/NifB/PqqE/SkfB family radical SAM enzyme
VKDGGLRVVIRLTHACDLACPHCLVESRTRDHELDTPAWLALLDGLPKLGTSKVLLTGGEPLLRDDLPVLVRSISAMGIPVDLNSNLYSLDLARLQELRQAGLTELSVSLEGPRAVHDRLHGKPGAFEQCVRGIQWGADLGIQVDVACCVTGENIEHLEELLAILRGLPVQSLTVSRLLPIGHGRKSRNHVPQERLTRLHAWLIRSVLPEYPLPIRVVGLLNPPQQGDCLRGRSLVGITPDGILQGCVLASGNPNDLPHPLEVGLQRTYEFLQQALASREYPLCWSRQEEPV